MRIDSEEQSVEAGTVIFVEAHADHRFFDIAEDLEVWFPRARRKRKRSGFGPTCRVSIGVARCTMSHAIFRSPITPSSDALSARRLCLRSVCGVAPTSVPRQWRRLDRLRWRLCRVRSRVDSPMSPSGGDYSNN